MKSLVVVLPLVALVAVCALLGEPERETVPAGVADLEIGRPVTSGNLTIFPVLSRTPRTADRFITLDEGLAAGTIEVVEVGADGQEIEPETPSGDDAAPANDVAPNAPAEVGQRTNATESLLVAVLENPPISPPSESNTNRPPATLLADVYLEPQDRLDELEAQRAAAEAGNRTTDDGLEAVLEQSIDLRPGSPAEPAVFENEPADESPWLEGEPNVAPEVGRAARLAMQFDGNPFSLGGGDEVQQGFGQGRLGFGGGPEVNRLLVRNTSGKPLYLMPGEVVVGGQQDRTVAEPTVLASSDEWQSIDAFCVESGRWEARGEALAASYFSEIQGGSVDDEVVTRLATEANRGKFVASNIALNADIRRTVLTGKGQDAVWEKVSEQNDKAGVADETESMAFTANYASADVVRELSGYERDLLESILQQPRVVGVVVAIDGEVRASDVFESTPLFRKLWPKLLKSYALDAYSHAVDEQPPAEERLATAEVDAEAARTFLVKAFSGRGRATGRGRGIELHEKTDDGVTAFGNVYGSPSGGDFLGGGLGGFGGAVQSSAFK